VAWQTTDEVPRVPSMLYVSPHLYVVTESGAARCLEAKTGKVLWRQRLAGKFSASPVWADGKIYLLSEKGQMSIVSDGPEYKLVAENELEGRFCASVAISQGYLFLRSDEAVYCIGP
jgi:outer membrane protein assembly factor BamB